MNKKYRYGGTPATVTDAAGIAGVLIKGLDGDFAFRVYHEDGEFTDYDLNHDDLSVTIAADEMASFYSFGERRVLDHSPAVLGLKKVEE